MSVNEGYIYLERKFFNNPLWTQKRSFSKAEAWIDLIQRANWKTSEELVGNKTVLVPRGSLLCSYRELAKRWGWSKDKVSAFFSLLQNQDSIQLKIRHTKTLLTLVNYELHQNKIPQTRQPQDKFKTLSRHSQDSQVSNSSSDEEIEASNKGNKYIYSIFDFWNSKEIIKHRDLTDKIKRAINGRLREKHTDREIKQAIENYTKILKSTDHYFSYKWTLEKFLHRGLDGFLDWEIASSNFKKGERKNGDRDDPIYARD